MDEEVRPAFCKANVEWALSQILARPFLAVVSVGATDLIYVVTETAEDAERSHEAIKMVFRDKFEVRAMPAAYWLGELEGTRSRLEDWRKQARTAAEALATAEDEHKRTLRWVLWLLVAAAWAIIVLAIVAAWR